MIRLLIVEDDRNLNKSLYSFFIKNQFEVFSATTVYEAYDILYETSIDLIISDIMMPEIDGFEFADHVRSLNETIPILFISARDDLRAKERGFSIGIDDYMVKPIEFEELLLRVKALLRRAQIIEKKEITVGEFILNKEEYTAKYKGELIRLTTREFDILYKLLSYPNKIFTRAQLMNEFWEIDSESSSRSVDVYMAKIRDKCSRCQEFSIESVRGIGYKVVINDDEKE
jgi:DNA-binding response OmpR family regulator